MSDDSKKQLSVAEIIALPRHQRRYLAKLNGLKNIPGSNTDHIQVAQRKYQETGEISEGMKRLITHRAKQNG